MLVVLICRLLIWIWSLVCLYDVPEVKNVHLLPSFVIFPAQNIQNGLLILRKTRSLKAPRTILYIHYFDDFSALLTLILV